jgi:hypothetical protein
LELLSLASAQHPSPPNTLGRRAGDQARPKAKPANPVVDRLPAITASTWLPAAPTDPWFVVRDSDKIEIVFETWGVSTDHVGASGSGRPTEAYKDHLRQH